MFEIGTKEEVFLRFGGAADWMDVPRVRGYPDHADDICTARALVDDGAMDELQVMSYRAGGQRVMVSMLFRPGTGQRVQCEAAEIEQREEYVE